MNYGKLQNGVLMRAPKMLAFPGRLIGNPSEAEYRAAGWLPIIDKPESNSTPAGWEEREGAIHRVYAPRPVEPEIILLSKAKICALVDRLGKAAEFFAWLHSKVEIYNEWQSLEILPYDPVGHNPIFESLLAALSITAEAAAPLIGEVRV